MSLARRHRPAVAPAISAEAQAFLRSTKPTRIPFPVPPPVAKVIRHVLAKKDAPVVARVQQQLGTRISHHVLNGVPVVEITPRKLRDGDDYAIHIHGGAYIIGAAHTAFGMQMADELQLPVLSIDYRLSPEVVYPAALDDCVRAYLGITAQRPRLPVLFGDSAGGGLVLALMQRLRDLDAVQPAALGLITPWTDLTPTGDSRVANDGRDPILTWHNQLDKAARAYAGTTPLDDPLVSPINATWDASLPPSVIMTGTRDLLLSDCVRLYWRLREAGARTELRVWEGMWHGFTGEPGIPEAEQCRREIATFLLAGLCDR